MRPKHLKTFPKSLFSAVLVLALLFGVQAATAAVTAEEAAKLKTTLTPFGAERAGNAEGTIPAWDGGYTIVPEGFKNGDFRADPFADEKPLFSITAKNLDQYKDKLAEGVQALLNKYPDFRVDIYPTHRTAAAPQWVYDKTFKNATRATLHESGYGALNAYGGVPFPIAKNGYEAAMNHRLAWHGVAVEENQHCWVVTADGKRALATSGIMTWEYPYYYPDGNLDTYEGNFWLGLIVYTGPPYKVGEAIMNTSCSDESKPRGIWQYLVGQRRVRRAPALAYDTPDSVTSGVGFFDEAFLIFGPMKHHDLKLVGKKEMYIPYNNNRAAAATVDDLVKPKFLNPDLVRWELHRVWVVEATLKEGKRHVVPRRLYYLDEDTWQFMMIDGWDAKGDLWRWCYTLTLLCPDIPCVTGQVMWGAFNLHTGDYFLNEAPMEGKFQLMKIAPRGKKWYTPSALANRLSR